MRYSKANPNCPTDLLIWTSRSYLSNILNGVPTHEQLREEIVGYGGDVLLRPLARLWDVLLASSSDPVALHDLDCPCLSIHEQTLILAIRNLHRQNRQAAIATLTAVVPPATAWALAADLQQLADAMVTLGDETKAEQKSGPARSTTGRPELRVVH